MSPAVIPAPIHVLLMGLITLSLACDPPTPVALSVLKVELTQDPNGDGRLSPAETVTVQITVTNQGSEESSADASCIPTVAQGPAQMLTTSPISFSFCGPNQICTTLFEIEVLPEAEPGAAVRVDCALPRDQGDVLSFTLPIEAIDVRLEITSITVLNDANHDGVLNPGEEAHVRVGLSNRGLSDVRASHCIVGSLDPGVLIPEHSDTLNYGRCDGGEACNSSEFSVDLSEASEGEARFTCDLIDTDEQRWPIHFTLPIERPAARPQIDTVLVINDDNQDELLQVGETATLRVAIQNVGPSALTRSDCLVTGDAHLEVLNINNRLRYNSCDTDAECNSSEIQVHALSAGTAQLSCPLENAEGSRWPLQITVEIH